MAPHKLIIDWPLTPYTGWGSYGIQLAQALISRGLARPVLTSLADRSPHCELPWLMKLDHLERFSKRLIDQLQQEPHQVLETNCRVVMGPIGNLVPPQRVCGEFEIGVAFYERTQLDERFLEGLDRFDLVITGSAWNQQLIQQKGYDRSVLVYQGFDDNHFHPTPVPQLINRPLIIFAGGKLEVRKGQDIVIHAFKEILKQTPDALLIACWGNIGNAGLDTIALSRYVKGSPNRGDSQQVYRWLIEQGIPEHNLLVPSITANSQLPALIKQADVAVFTSRCEGGTNLMAMETLACGIPTVLSANTGHLDLLELKLDHAIAVGRDGLGKVPEQMTAAYGGDADGRWGETSPLELCETVLSVQQEKERWRQRAWQGAHHIKDLTWRSSMEKLTQELIIRKIL